MTSDIRLAFSHPEERAAASFATDPRDRISLRDHVVDVDIGAFQLERGTQQRVRFNIAVEVRPQSGPLEDDVDRILSYEVLVEAIAIELAAERLNLLETLAERVAERILHEPRAMRAFVRVEKLDIGPYALGVEIVRSRAEVPVQLVAGDAGVVQHPVVVFVGNNAIADEGLSDWLDRLAALDAPVILTVGLPGGAPPQSAAGAAQRRIDLLAIEQNAWVLAGRDRRCLVVSTRTEIDWAMKHRQMVVWAPSKLVLDAVDGPGAGPRNPVALALWLAESLSAVRMEIMGAGQGAAPAGSRVPVETSDCKTCQAAGQPPNPQDDLFPTHR